MRSAGKTAAPQTAPQSTRVRIRGGAGGMARAAAAGERGSASTVPCAGAAHRMQQDALGAVRRGFFVRQATQHNSKEAKL